MANSMLLLLTSSYSSGGVSCSMTTIEAFMHLMLVIRTALSILLSYVVELYPLYNHPACKKS